MPTTPVVRRFMGGSVTPIAPVAAVPTTAAHLSVWNGGPKTVFIDAASFTTIVSAGAVISMQLLAHISGPNNAVISGTVANGPKATDGNAGPSVCQVYSAVTLSALAFAGGMWHPLGGSADSAGQTPTISTGTYQIASGLYVLPPGGIFSLAGFCSAAATATCNLFVQWREQ